MTRNEHLWVIGVCIAWSLVCVTALTVITRSIRGWVIDSQ
jgi:hypothetical protein